ncbi:asparagine synthase (glutamine-hydrolyzing) [Candidatus Woesearchaeota archaeon]|nr:asparagine synthase (glutamine-hydrolyzing) [Candidatus Woesearchaeota archaeon]
MSSILGICNFDRNIDKVNFSSMCKALSYSEGKDSKKHIDKGIALFSRVNSIEGLDLSQPVYNKDESIVVIGDARCFNKKKLGFEDSSELEVFLKMYEKYGPSFISMIDGIFAIAVWDLNKKKLFLYKDKIAVKPLFYYNDNNLLVFSSEQKAILRYHSYKLDYDREAVRNFLTFRYNYSDDTLFKGIKKIPAGSFLEFSKEGLKIRRYYSTLIKEDNSKSERYLTRRLKELLLDSVEKRLVSDKPVAAFLSGGVDSGGTVGLLKQFTDNIHTYSVGFAGYGFDELKRAKSTADFYSTEHTEINLKPDIMKKFGKIIYALDEPMADLASIPNYVMSEYAQKKGFNIVFSGETNDEVWGGYEEYVEVPNRMKISKLFFPGLIGKKIIPSFISLLPNSKIKTLIDHCDRYYDPIRCYNRQINFYDEEKLYTSQFKNYVDMSKKPKTEITKRYLKGSGSLNNRLLLKSIHYLAIHGYMVKADRMTRKFGLDLNMPLIDSSLVDFSFTVPFRYKVKNGTEKYLYRQALKSILPPVLLKRQKRGFNVPTRAWIPELKDHVLHFLDDKTLEKRGIFEKRYIHQLMQKINNPNVVENQDLWNLLVLELWFRIYFDGMDFKKRLF